MSTQSPQTEARHLVRPATDERIAEGEHGHPSDAQYLVVAAVLAVLTGIEVGLYYIENLNHAALTSALLVLAALKFSMVALFFMHLRFDNRILRRFFVFGLVIAGSVYTAYLLSLGVLVGR